MSPRNEPTTLINHLDEAGCVSVQIVADLSAVIEAVEKSVFELAFVLRGERLIGFVSLLELRRHHSSMSPSLTLEDSGVRVTQWANSGLEIEHLLDQFEVVPLTDGNSKFLGASSTTPSRQVQILSPNLGTEEVQALEACALSGWISSQGPTIGVFEKNFLEMIGFGSGLAVSNGTIAIELGLEALGIGIGDEVLVPDLTFGATANAVLSVGASPVFVDTSGDFGNIDFDHARTLLTPKTRAIIPVHLYGMPVDIPELKKFKDETGLLVIEDCAEALGSRFNGEHVGQFGDVATFSFFANKTITTGEGGFVVFADESLTLRAKQIRDHGMSPARRYWHEIPGHNYRMTAMQAAVGIEQIKKAPGFLEKKLEIAETYRTGFSGVPGMRTPVPPKQCGHSQWISLVFLDSKEYSVARTAALLQKRGIETRPIFSPLRDMPAFSDGRQETHRKETWNSDTFSKQGLCLPSSTGMSTKTQNRVINEVLSALDRQRRN